MTYIKDIELELNGEEQSGGPVDVRLTVTVELSEWEVEQNQRYYARAWILEQDGQYDEMIFLPNWHNRYYDTVTDQDRDEILTYLGWKQFQPNNDSVQTITFDGELSKVDILRAASEASDDNLEDEEYYPFVVVEPEMHTVMKVGDPVRFDFSMPIT